MWSYRVVRPVPPQELLDHPPDGWEPLFQKARCDLQYTLMQIQKEHERRDEPIHPSLDTIFYFFQRFHPKSLRVVILTDEPPPDCQDGLGIVHSSDREYEHINQRLLDTLGQTFDPFHWMEEGIGFLTVSLTVGGHYLWGGFITHVMAYLNRICPRVIYLLWGEKACEMNPYCKKQKVFKSGSPKEFYRHARFSTMEHFSEVNELIRKRGEKPIQW